MSLYFFVVFPLFAALLGYLFNSRLSKSLIFLVQFVLFIMATLNFIEVRTKGPILEVLGKYPLGVGISLKADIISSVLILLTVFLFSCLLIYNYHKSYMNHLFLFLFLILQGLLCGLFLSNDLFNIYVLIEVSTIIVSILIIFKKDSKSIYDGMIYLLTNLASMTLFLLGLGYLYRIFGTLDLTLLAERIPEVKSPRTLIIPFALLITAVDLKAAIMPLFSWLPKAHGTASAPSIISATLSGLYVKSGVYIFIRIIDLFQPVFEGREVFMIFGFMTAVIGFVFAISQSDIKLILAYSTVSQIGLIVFGLSIHTAYSYYGAVYHIVNHAIFKSTLFLTAGIIVDEYHTRELNQIRGVMKRMPYVAIATFLAILGITGAPLFNGSVSKYMIQRGSGEPLLFEIGFFIINLGTIMTFVKYSTIFLGKSNERHFIRWNQRFVVLLLGFICFLGGVFGPWLMNVFFGFDVHISLGSLTSKFILYVLNIIIAVLFYFLLYHKIKLFQKIREMELYYNQIITSIIIFYSGFLAYLYIIYG